MNRESDELIYRRYLAKRGEGDFRILLERHRESLILFLMSYVQSIEDAEELMMDAYAVAASGTSAFSGRSSFKTWLFGIARNQARTFLRKKKGVFFSFDEISDKTHSELAEGLPAVETPELALLRQEKNRELYAALETLPKDYRQVLYLLYFENMSVEETASVMKKTRKQIYNLTERGRKALKAALERMGFNDTQYR